ncbi:MAG: peroxidase [Hyphomonadaceae bacterium BRH_c29]|nr:MAG: peroxidase [Hyphomonadaceae bacterium BRH_c29]
MTGEAFSLRTPNPTSGFELAIRLARLAVKTTQPDADIRKSLRADYDQNAGLLIEISHIVAVHFNTIAAANAYWLDPELAQ